ncbi:MAG: hypothetical protein H8E55_67075 [Pelagibacterales bacterium]|nr:hypothetical protein [Pelagibacterales bacterium]
MLTLSIILTVVIVVSIFIIRNLLIKNERLTDFIAKQSDAINVCDKKLKELDNKGFFRSDDMVGWFFDGLKEIQASLNEFTLK